MGMEHHKDIITRGLPKTGQVLSYRTGDDGTYQVGWWLKRLVSSNKPRYTIKILDGVQVVFDRCTGLVWPRDLTGAGCNGGVFLNWAAAIDFCNNLNYAGFTDWRLPNLFEHLSIINVIAPGSHLEPLVWVNDFDEGYWTSTTHHGATTYAYYIDRSTIEIAFTEKTGELPVHPVRGGV